MSLFSVPVVASIVARAMQAGARRGMRAPYDRFPEFPRHTEEMIVPTSVAPARATVYLPVGVTRPPVYVNFHGGGFVLPLLELDDPLCRFLAAEAGVVVVNVDYVLAPQHRFPAPAVQAYDTVRWIAERGGDRGWDTGRICVGGQSAGGSIAAAVARQAHERSGPPISLQVLHYPVLDIADTDKTAAIAKPMLRPWMREVFDTSYVSPQRHRTDRLVSPAHSGDTTDLTGIAPAVVITAEHDLLRDEGQRYAQRLESVGALTEHHDITGVDHGYDVKDADKAREVYAHIAEHVRTACR